VGTSLPDAAVFHQKEASFPDQHGDYGSYLRVTVPDTTYRRLLASVRRDPTWHRKAAPLIGGDVLETPLPRLLYGAEANKDHDAYVFIGFGVDERTVIVYRVSS